MKIIFRNILKYYLKFLTKIVLIIHRPIIIGIAGSTNKSFVRMELIKILNEKGLQARSHNKSFNTNISMPLAILYLESGYNSYLRWLPIILKAFLSIFKLKFPQILVLEYGISKPGDMRYLLSIARPDITIITEVTKRYLESFSDMDELAEEYELLIKKTKKNGLILLNNDNIRVSNLKNIAKNEVILYGFSENSDIKVISSEKIELGQKVKYLYKNFIYEIIINKFGNHHIYTLLIGQIIKNYVEKYKKL